MYKITFSEKNYQTKPTPQECKQMKFKEENLTKEEIIEKLRNGYTYCYNLLDNQKIQSKQNFKNTHCIYIDFDDSPIDITTFHQNINPKPTYTYTTFSNTPHRYRALYLFNQTINNQTERHQIYQTIINQYQQTFGNNFINKIDIPTSSSPYKIIYGTNQKQSNYKEYITNNTYNKQTFLSNQQLSQTNNNIKNKYDYNQLETIKNKQQQEEIIKDIKNKTLTTKQIIIKYSSQYQYLTNNKHKYQTNNGIITVDENYCEIQRTYEGYKKIKKIQKGNRDNMLYITALYFIKIIGQQITLGHLCYCLLNEITHFYDNSDGELTPTYILKKAKQALKNKNNIQLKQNKKQHVIDKSRLQPSKSPQKALAETIINKKIQETLQYYDFSQSIRKNEKTLNQLYQQGKLTFKPTKTWLNRHITK